METPRRPAGTVAASVREGLRAGLRQSRWLLSIIVPVSLGVFILRQMGILAAISQVLTPLFGGLGLTGVSALAFVVGVITNPYAVVGIIGTAGLASREIAILSVMSLIAHNFPVELAIMKRTGSSILRMFVVRLTAAAVASFGLHLLLPTGAHAHGHEREAIEGGQVPESLHSGGRLWPAFGEWALSALELAVTIALVLCVLMVAVHLLRRLGVIEALARVLRPFMRMFGLPEHTAFLWVVCNLLGLTYGAAVLLEEERTGRLGRADGDLLNHHVSIFHSVFEDTVVFVAVGAPLLWITVPRIVLAVLAVWVRRAELRMRLAIRHARGSLP